MVILASCGANEVSHEMPEEGHGAFTHFLLEGLAGQADDNKDGLVGASELSTYAWEQTRLWAAGKGLMQNPWRIEEVSGEIILAKVGGTIASARPSGPTAELPPGRIAAEPAPSQETLSYLRKEFADGRFIDNGNGTVLDTNTGLVWQRGDSGEPVSANAQMTLGFKWRYIKEMNEIRFGGRSDWRMPTKKDFQSLTLSAYTETDLPFANSGKAVYWYSGGLKAGAYKWREDKANPLALDVTGKLIRAVAGP